MGFGDIMKTVGKVGLSVAAPFTGPAAPFLMAGANALGAIGGGGGGGKSTDPMANITNYGKMVGDEGKKLLDSGAGTIAKSNNLFTPITQRNQQLLSGDMNTIGQALLPETDAIGQQFQNVRDMIASQPRGPGKTSTLARLPIEHLRTISNLVSNERNAAANNQSDIAGKFLSAGESERGMGLEGLSSGGNIMLGKGAQDLTRRGQNLDLGSKIAETVAELAFLLKGSGGGGKGGGDYSSQGWGNGTYGPGIDEGGLFGAGDFNPLALNA